MTNRTNWQKPQTIKLMIELDDSPKIEKDLDRGAKYRFLVDDNRHKRQEIVNWLIDNGTANAVLGMGDATAFNILFLEASQNIASTLRRAPHVKHVSQVDSIAVNLLALHQEPVPPSHS